MSDVYSHGEWTVKEGHEDEFVAAWTEFAKWFSGMDGMGTAHLSRSLDDPQSYMSFGNWKSADAMHAWKESPDFAEKMGAIRQHADLKPTEWEQVVEV